MGSSKREREAALSHTVQLTIEHEHDFWARVDRTEGGCWNWLGSQDHKGYGQLVVDTSRIGAHRIAWVLEHNKSLPSYQQVRRTCRGNKRCVRPAHLHRTGRTYQEYAKSVRNPKFYILRPPERGATDAPRNKVIHELAGSHEELRDLKHLLRGLTSSLPQNHEFVVQNIAKTGRLLTAVNKRLDGLHDELREWGAAVDQRLAMIERHLTEARAIAAHADVEPETAPEPAPEPEEPEPTAEPPPEKKPEKKPERSPEATVLMSAFRSELGGPDEPDDDDYESLEMVFDIALAESPGDPGQAVEQFGSWLSSFRELTAEHPSMERTPQGFAREVSAQRLQG